MKSAYLLADREPETATERFYLGGADSVLRYEAHLVPPLVNLVDKKVKKQLVPQGGKSMANNNIEILSNL